MPFAAVDLHARTKERPANLLSTKTSHMGQLSPFLWIVLDTIVFLLLNLVDGIIFFIMTLILIYGLLNILGCLRPCYNCIKCTHGMGRLAALYFGRRIFKDYKYNYKLPPQYFLTLYIGAFPATRRVEPIYGEK
jgi:hypothetical protein